MTRYMITLCQTFNRISDRRKSPTYGQCNSMNLGMNGEMTSESLVLQLSKKGAARYGSILTDASLLTFNAAISHISPITLTAILSSSP
jgi:hypothetical protein